MPASIAELARRIVDAGDTGALLGDRPPGGVCRGGRGVGAVIGMVRTIGPLKGGSVAAGLHVLCRSRGGFGRRRRGGLGTLSGHSVLLRLERGVGVRGGTGVGRRHRLIHGLVLRLSGGRRPVDAARLLRADETAGGESCR